MRRAIIYFAWGDRYIAEAIGSAHSISMMRLPIFLITNKASVVPSDAPFQEIVRVDITDMSLEAKSKLYAYLPDGYDSFLFLDTDTVVLRNPGLGFSKAEKWGIAAAMAPHYSLSDFWSFGSIMERAGVPLSGQMQYNTGVIFFIRRLDVERVFNLWSVIIRDYGPFFYKKTDQPYFTLALELMDFNPYTLSPSYNYRNAGQGASGPITIWHSHDPVPHDVNVYEVTWPPRRFMRSRRVKLQI